MRTENKYHYLLYISFIPIVINGFIYLIIGSFFPLLVALILTLTLMYSVNDNLKWKFRAVKYWGILLLLYSLLRICLSVLILIDGSGVEAYIKDQLNSWFHIQTLFFLICGWVLVKKRRML
ncbi:hypothetical protein GWK08_09230 [Leptobacterium flavescens]|uniref:Uncharacterized protein n=1 Tax=Leptobacterium flavescens TaxID=472055 RepID=A0A6P0UNW9_9FLAO|nr:hypothetical protein [Leptobacterium flavescens]NER13618.1 hypothetical protein [Leptobacterium flavescens]